jgi:hypothetical protein
MVRKRIRTPTPTPTLEHMSKRCRTYVSSWEQLVDKHTERGDLNDSGIRDMRFDISDTPCLNLTRIRSESTLRLAFIACLQFIIEYVDIQYLGNTVSSSVRSDCAAHMVEELHGHHVCNGIYILAARCLGLKGIPHSNNVAYQYGYRFGWNHPKNKITPHIRKSYVFKLQFYTDMGEDTIKLVLKYLGIDTDQTFTPLTECARVCRDIIRSISLLNE